MQEGCPEPRGQRVGNKAPDWETEWLGPWPAVRIAVGRCIRLMGSWTRCEPTMALSRLLLCSASFMSCCCTPESVKEDSEQDQTRNKTTGAFGSLQWSFILHAETRLIFKFSSCFYLCVCVCACLCDYMCVLCMCECVSL